MKSIDLGQLSVELFHNHLDVLETEEGLLPVRFTPHQMEIYEVELPWKIRSRCPAGICLDFVTDSAFLELAYQPVNACRVWCYFDIFVDGLFVDSIGTASWKENPGSWKYEIKGKPGCKRITIYLPHTVELYLKSLTLSPGAAIEPAQRYSKNLLCLGDSITQGMDSRKPSGTYPVLLSRLLGMNVLNHGVGGYIFAEESLDASIPYRPDAITVAYGTNDWGKSATAEEFQSKCSAFLNKLAALYPETPIFVLTPLWRADENRDDYFASFHVLRGIIRQEAEKHSNMTVLDGNQLIPHLPQLYGDEKLHPNDEGFLHIASNVYGAMVRKYGSAPSFGLS